LEELSSNHVNPFMGVARPRERSEQSRLATLAHSFLATLAGAGNSHERVHMFELAQSSHDVRSAHATRS
jgi:hypothetical protein